MYAVNVNVDINNQILILKNVNLEETQKYYIQYIKYINVFTFET